jgi:hypothetical protein
VAKAPAKHRPTAGGRSCRCGRLPVLPVAGRAGAGFGPPGREPPGPEGRILVLMKPAHAASRRLLPGSPFNVLPVDAPVEQFTVRDQVTHDKYGLGRVVLVEDNDAVIVSFGSRRVRVLSPFATLTKL